MLFRRRHKLPFGARLSGWLWPRSGLVRAGKYLGHRVARLPGTVHSIAAGLASGIAVSFTPFLGLHFAIGFLLAFVTRGNLIASAIGTFIGNPWTFPFIFALMGQTGGLILGRDIAADVPDWSWGMLIAAPLDYLGAFLPLLFPLVVGSLPVAVLVWFLAYFSVKAVLSGYRAARQERLHARRNARAVSGRAGPRGRRGSAL
ncbi:DUF2062 domain-containing protein [Yunchengibacter salinarum]|uniref:DUF2062 domain-containing protein n=1 Tax=Yunchengibacter salinarum TaxID=3133399 RepID=UPI0035B6A6B9